MNDLTKMTNEDLIEQLEALGDDYETRLRRVQHASAWLAGHTPDIIELLRRLEETSAHACNCRQNGTGGKPSTDTQMGQGDATQCNVPRLVWHCEYCEDCGRSVEEHTTPPNRDSRTANAAGEASEYDREQIAYMRSIVADTVKPEHWATDDRQIDRDALRCIADRFEELAAAQSTPPTDARAEAHAMAASLEPFLDSRRVKHRCCSGSCFEERFDGRVEWIEKNAESLHALLTAIAAARKEKG